jgi:hypothetical protein
LLLVRLLANQLAKTLSFHWASQWDSLPRTLGLMSGKNTWLNMNGTATNPSAAIENRTGTGFD